MGTRRQASKQFWLSSDCPVNRILTMPLSQTGHAITLTDEGIG